MGENPDPSSPPSADHLLPKSENPRRPPTSMTIPRGGSAGGEEETPSQLPPWPFEPWPETIVEETTSQLPPWPFSPGPETVVEETPSQLPSRPFSPCPETVVEETPSQLQSQPFVPWPETVVEETPGVWDSEGSPAESGKKEDDGEALSSMRSEEDGS